MIKLTKIQLERIEQIIDRKIKERVSEFKKTLPVITREDFMKSILDGKIKPRKDMIDDSEFCSRHNIEYFFDTSKIDSQQLENSKKLGDFQFSLMSKKQGIIDRIILDGQTVDWALKQLDKEA